MFPSVSLLCVTLSVFPIYNIGAPSQLFSPTEIADQAFKRSLNESEDALYQAYLNWESSHKDLIKLAETNIIAKENLMNLEDLIFKLRQEWLVMVDGSHFVFPLSEKNETDQQYKITSIAVSKLLMNLKTMQQTDHLLQNITLNLYLNNYELFVRSDFVREVSDETTSATLLQDFFRILNYRMETDELLRDEYKKRVNEARETVKNDPKMSGPMLIEVLKAGYDTQKTKELLSKLIQDHKTFCRSTLNSLFLALLNEHVEGNFSSDHEFIERYSLVRALNRKAVASSSGESKLNDLYQRALIEATKEFWNESTWNYGVKEGNTKIKKVFFDSLEKTFKSDRLLYEEIESLKKEIQTLVYKNAHISHPFPMMFMKLLRMTSSQLPEP